MGLLATITLKVVSFCAYASFPAFLPFFKCTLELVFCDGVQHQLLVLSSIGGTEKSRVGG
jgi:hypothetical protein